ncbi:hypothetical protein ACSNOD_31840, partial [Streptomyces sp. URMC 123]
EGHSPFRQHTPLSTLRAIVDAELPPPRRAGPLAPALEGLLRKDPALRMGADEAERLLRIVAAGGTPRAAPAAGGFSADRSPTVPAAPPEPPWEPTTARAPAPYGSYDTYGRGYGPDADIT